MRSALTEEQGAGIIDCCGTDAPVETSRAGGVLGWVIGGAWVVAFGVVISIEFGVVGWIVIASVVLAIAALVTIGPFVGRLWDTRTRSGRTSLDLRFELAVDQDGEWFLEFLDELAAAHPWVESRTHDSAWIEERGLDTQSRWYDGATATHFIRDPSDPGAIRVFAVSERAPGAFWPTWQRRLLEVRELSSLAVERIGDELHEQLKKESRDRLRREIRSGSNG